MLRLFIRKDALTTGQQPPVRSPAIEVKKTMNIPSILIMFFLSGLAGLPAGAAVSDTPTGREYAETILLLSDKEADVRFGIKSLHKKDMIEPSSLDLLAEIASAGCSGKRKVNPDTLAWTAKTIGKSGQGRYAPLIDDCLAKAWESAKEMAKDKSKVKETSLIRYLTEAQTALAGSPRSNPFKGGEMNLDNVHDELKKNCKVVPASLASTQFAGVASGQRMDEVYNWLGTPDKVGAMAEPRGKVGFMFVKVGLSDDRIVFSYPGLGEVRFGYDKSTKDWVVANASSSQGLHWLAKDGRFVTMNEAITDGEKEDLRLVVKRLSRQIEPINEDILDRIADRIYLSQKENDGKMADALAHLCKLLGKSRNGKYKQLLREVSEKAAHGKLRKHAALAANSLPDSSEAMYEARKSGS
jgi:hypothetical protein